MGIRTKRDFHILLQIETNSGTNDMEIYMETIKESIISLNGPLAEVKTWINPEGWLSQRDFFES